MIAGSTTFRCPENVLSRRLADEVVLLDMASEAYFSLNEVGARILEAIQSGSDFDDLVSKVVTEFDGAPADRVRSDAAELLDELVAKGLLEQANE